MNFVDKIMNSLSIFDEEEVTEEELLAEEKAAAEKKEKRSLFAKKTPQAETSAQPKEQEAEEKPKRSSVLNFKGRQQEEEPQPAGKMGSKTLNLPVANKLVTVVVLEPVDFDDSQKIADFLRNNEPVVVNFENTDNVLAKRMTDFLSGTVYALAGNMKKLSRNILICAPKNIDIDSDLDAPMESKADEGGNRSWEK